MLFPEMEEERAAHEYAAHIRYKVPPYDAGQMDEGDRTQHAATGRCAIGVRITLLPGLARYKPYHRGG